MNLTKTAEFTKEEVSNLLDALTSLYDTKRLGEWPQDDVEALDSGYQKLVALELEFLREGQ